MPRQIELPSKLKRLAITPARYKVIYGGRGSAKSESVARLLVLRSMTSERRILCCREFQTSIRESVHALIKSVINSHGLELLFDINFHSIKCRLNGSEFIFTGLAQHTVDSIKSIYGVTDVWVEEAQRLSSRSMDILIPTIRSHNSELFFTLNPELETDPVYNRFVHAPDPLDDAIVVEMNYDDNPWFPDVLKKEMEACKRRSVEDYLHIWRGKTVTFTKASILGHLVREQAFEPDPAWTPYYGIDWGFAADPTVCARVFVSNRNLFLRNEFYGHGVEINEYARCFSVVPGANIFELQADNSRPESISYLNNPQNYEDKRPLKVKAAPKWSGSVEDGIGWLRSLDAIIIHPDCTHALFEVPRYSWKVDKITGAILPVPADGNDHVADAIRYACHRFIKKKLTMFDVM